MRTKNGILLALSVLFAGKYVQLALFPSNLVPGSALVAFTSLIITALSLNLLQNTWKKITLAFALAGFILSLWFFYSQDPLTYLFMNLLVSLAIFTFLFPLHSYETRKYPSFGSAFLTIYSLTEGIALIRNSYDLIIFAVYLTLSLAMFVPGIMKIKENQ